MTNDHDHDHESGAPAAGIERVGLLAEPLAAACSPPSGGPFAAGDVVLAQDLRQHGVRLNRWQSGGLPGATRAAARTAVRACEHLLFELDGGGTAA
ncbi:hypothetical protein ACFCX4_32285 [Kitasatospora sp. NPDC056327]|uniref:hypothetical protein n=1 Tax=Kitasatospora sp. NPDC056327 TaxID=3345785 RepID=UPI0035E18499